MSGEEGHGGDSNGGGSAPAAAAVELGFVEPILVGEDVDSSSSLRRVGHRSPNCEEDWDGGGQVGGRPSWLVPVGVPSPPICRHCCCRGSGGENGKGDDEEEDLPRMAFVCQIYAPIDSIREKSAASDDGSASPSPPDRAYHRTLYVFACPSCADATESVRVLRAQLPPRNPYYPPPPGDGGNQQRKRAGEELLGGGGAVEEEVYTPGAAKAAGAEGSSWDRHLPGTWKTRLCASCGMAAKYRCPLQGRYFCSRDHQREYKRHVFDAAAVAGGEGADEVEESLLLPSLYPLSELVVEREPDAATASDDGRSRAERDVDDDDESDSDRDLEQDDLNEIVQGGTNRRKRGKDANQDPHTMAFYSRIKDRPDVQEQCLRYCRWPEGRIGGGGDDDDEGKSGGDDDAILWLHGSHRPEPDQIPPCSHCGSPRRFEFQLMPQLLHYLLRKQKRPEEDGGGTGSGGDNRSAAEGGGGDAATNFETFKEALRQTDALLKEAPPEVIPPALVQNRDAAVERIQKDLMEGKSGIGRCGGGKGKKEGGKNRLDGLDWGVVAVYTCTASCGGCGGSPAEGGRDDAAYREEFAWRQPPLDS